MAYVEKVSKDGSSVTLVLKSGKSKTYPAEIFTEPVEEGDVVKFYKDENGELYISPVHEDLDPEEAEAEVKRPSPSSSSKPPQKKKKHTVLKVIGIVFAVFFIIGIIGSLSSDDAGSSGSSSAAASVATSKPTSTPITYTSVDAQKLVDDLKDNALNAANTYKGQYISVTGQVSNIDASGQYIDIDPVGSTLNFTFIQCYIKTDDVRNVVASLSKGDVITVNGKCDDVGEVMGYSINIDSISK